MITQTYSSVILARFVEMGCFEFVYLYIYRWLFIALVNNDVFDLVCRLRFLNCIMVMPCL